MAVNLTVTVTVNLVVVVAVVVAVAVVVVERTTASYGHASGTVPHRGKMVMAIGSLKPAIHRFRCALELLRVS
jgi:hypothetical protein